MTCINLDKNIFVDDFNMTKYASSLTFESLIYDFIETNNQIYDVMVGFSGLYSYLDTVKHNKMLFKLIY